MNSYIEAYQHDIEKLLATGMSKRKIAKSLEIPKSSLSDWLRISPMEQPIEPATQDASQYVCGIVTSKVGVGGSKGRTHIVIPDTQCKPNINKDYLRWYGEYIAKKMPDVIVHLGDHADFESLSSYDKGKKSAEGKRVQKDIEASIEGMNLLLNPIKELQDSQKKLFGAVLYKPRMVLTLGNHEERLMRHVEANPELEGFLSYDNLRYREMGWEVYDYLEPVEIDGITYIHYFPNPFTGKPYGGSALNILQKVGGSFTQGHKQTLDVATRTLHTGEQQWAIICGASYPHDEKYKGYCGNKHWRGIIVKHNVKNGSYDPLFVAIDYLKERYSHK